MYKINKKDKKLLSEVFSKSEGMLLAYGRIQFSSEADTDLNPIVMDRILSINCL
jgi:hypothetical protein